MENTYEDAESGRTTRSQQSHRQQDGAGPQGGLFTWQMMDMVSRFSGQDRTFTAAKFIEDIDDNGEIFDWTEKQRLLIARRSLTGTAQLWLNSEKVFKTWDEFKKAILKEFPDAIDSKTIHELMSSTKKRPDETCIDYMLSMKSLGKRGKLADYVAIKYIVEGIPDQEIYKIMLYGVTSYVELKEKLKIYEQLKENMKLAEARKPEVCSADSTQKMPGYVRCYNCGERKHISLECPHRNQGTKCFKCNEFGHLSSECQKIAALTASTSADGKMAGSSGNSRKFGSTVQGRQHAEPKQLMVAEMQDGAYCCDVCASGSKNEVYDVDDDNQREIMVLTAVGNTVDNGGIMTAERKNMNVMNCQRHLNINKNGPECLLEKPTKTVEISGKSALSLIDSGSEVNLVTCEYYNNEIGAPVRDINKCVVLSGLGSSKVDSVGQFSCEIMIDDRKYVNVNFYVVPRDSIPYKVVLGQEFLCKVCMLMSGGCVWLQPINEVWFCDMNCVNKNDIVPTDHISKNIIEEVMRCVEEYKPLQTKEAPIEMKIIMKGDRSASQRPGSISIMVEQEEVERQISEWLDKGIVHVSYSEYSSPLVFVRKKDGKVPQPLQTS